MSDRLMAIFGIGVFLLALQSCIYRYYMAKEEAKLAYNTCAITELTKPIKEFIENVCIHSDKIMVDGGCFFGSEEIQSYIESKCKK